MTLSPPKADLASALQELRRADLPPLYILPPRKQLAVLKDVEAVRNVAHEISKSDARDARWQVQKFLDDLFGDFRSGQEFEHVDVVLAVLAALRESDARHFRDVARVFSASKAPEIAALSRFAHWHAEGSANR